MTHALSLVWPLASSICLRFSFSLFAPYKCFSHRMVFPHYLFSYPLCSFSLDFLRSRNRNVLPHNIFPHINRYSRTSGSPCYEYIILLKKMALSFLVWMRSLTVIRLVRLASIYITSKLLYVFLLHISLVILFRFIRYIPDNWNLIRSPILFALSCYATPLFQYFFRICSSSACFYFCSRRHIFIEGLP